MRADRCGKVLQNAFDIRKHVVVPESQDAPALLFKKSSAPLVLFDRCRVLTAIEFDDEPSLCAREVDDVRADWHLPSELQIVEAAVTQTKPEHALRVGLRLAQIPSAIGALLCPHPGPLPQAGEGERD